MNAKPKRRWFQFSLSAMLVVMTLVAILLGRVAYLRQMAVFHDREQARHLVQWRQDYAADSAREEIDRAMYFYHHSLGDQCRRATYRPWMIVYEKHPEIRP